MNLLETYKDRMAICESVYAKEHGNSTMSNHQKLVVAKVLANTSAFLTEAMSHSMGTQRSDLGQFKKFTLDLVTVALPNLIANELVITHPMSSITGYIQYINFVAGADKGEVANGDLINNPFKLGENPANRIDYTGDKVTEAVDNSAGTSALSVTLAWTPCVKEAFGTNQDVKFTDSDGNVSYLVATDNVVSIPAGKKGTLAYVYDNIIVPQDKIPTLRAKMEGLTLHAKARRIAIFYSNIAAFQAKTEMGIDLGDLLQEQACAEMSYEIDTEIVKLLDDNAEDLSGEEAIVFNKRLPVGVSMRDHYASFVEVVEKASQRIYDRTQKHAANYMVCSSSIKPILALCDGFKPASTGKINGPYMAGNLNGVKVFISSAIAKDRFFCGYNGDDLVTSAAVFAPYCSLLPTQLLEFADGGNSQGFAVMYDLVLLNSALLVPGKVTEASESGATAVIRG